MPGWQIAYHLIFFSVSILVFVVLRWRRGRENGGMILWVPVSMAAVAELIINSIWPEMLLSSSTAGVGLIIAWMINSMLGFAAWFLVRIYPESK